MGELELGRQVVEDAPEPGGTQDHQDLPPRHEPAERPRHADVLVDAGERGERRMADLFCEYLKPG